jgi:preprotein translocase subunit SecG
MTVLEYVLGGVLIAVAIFLTVIVLAQSGKDKSLSGTIAGGASSDTYFGKNKGQSREKLLARLTMVAAIVFAVLVVVLYVLIARQ